MSYSADDSAAIFFQDMVEPTVSEFRADPADARRGFLACLVLSAQIDHAIAASPELASLGTTKAIAQLRSENWAVYAVRDAANAFKHVNRDPGRGKWGYEDFGVHEVGQCGVLRAGWPINGRAVLAGAGREWRLIDLVEAAANYWRDRLGI